MKAESLRDRIFRAARELFDQEGEAGISMRRIASAVGVTPMAIYKHYADKDALLSALMLDSFAAWEMRVAQISEDDPVAWLQQLGERFLDFALNEPRRYEAAFLLKASQARQYPNDFADGKSPAARMAQERIERVRPRGVGAASATDVVLALGALCQGLVSIYRAGRFTSEADFRAAYGRAVAHCIASYTLESPR
jgi:AcrR family transcriptional regulator